VRNVNVVIVELVSNRLELGRSVAAPAIATLADHKAWVFVRPVIDSSKGYLEHKRGGEPTLKRVNINENPINGFYVRYIEIHRRYEEYPLDYDLVGFSIDQEYVVNDEKELENILHRWLNDSSELVSPANAGYIFGN
jgi:hypothetical protein